MIYTLNTFNEIQESFFLNTFKKVDTLPLLLHLKIPHQQRTINMCVCVYRIVVWIV